MHAHAWVHMHGCTCMGAHAWVHMHRHESASGLVRMCTCMSTGTTGSKVINMKI